MRIAKTQTSWQKKSRYRRRMFPTPRLIQIAAIKSNWQVAADSVDIADVSVAAAAAAHHIIKLLRGA
jgi:hypothetical protein